MRGARWIPLESGTRTDTRRFFTAAIAALSIIALGPISPAPVALSSAGRLAAQQTGLNSGDRAPEQKEPPVESDDDAAGREQRVLRQVIYRDRQTQAAVDQADVALSSGESSLALENLQRVFDQGSDHFVWIEREHRLASARRRATELLSRADAKTRELYEWSNARAADRLWEAGKAAGDALRIAEVARRYFHTAAGFAATDWLATRWLDRGEFALAVRAWQLLANDPFHQARITPEIRKKTEIAAALLARKLGARPRTTPLVEVRTAELPSDDPATTIFDVARPVIQASAVEPDSTRAEVVGGNEAHAARPYMVPAWRIPLSNGNKATINAAVTRWENEQQREDRRPVGVQTPLIAGSALAFRTYDGISAVNAATGRSLWNYVSRTSFNRALADVEPASPVATETESPRERTVDAMLAAYAGNSVLGMLSTDGLRVFAIDSVDLRQRNSPPLPDEPAIRRTDSDRISRNTNRLIALDLFSPQRGDGGNVEPRWSLGGSTGMPNWFFRMDADDDGRVTQNEFQGSVEEFRRIDRNGDGAIERGEAELVDHERRPLCGHYFLGPPLPLDGRLYAITESDCQLNLVGIKAENGEVLWVQGIGYVDHPINEDSVRSALACTPIHAGGVIICPTQIGVLVGVDGTDGALLWSYYYGDEDVAGADSGWSFFSHRPSGNPGFNPPPVIAGNRIIVRPRHSDSIHCIDLGTGRGVWKKSRLDGEFVAAAAGGVVMVVGERQCRGLSIVDGSQRWTSRWGEVSGTGFAAGDQYLLPLANNRIVSIDIRTGAVQEPPTARDRYREADSAALAFAETVSDVVAPSDGEGTERPPAASSTASNVLATDGPGNLAGNGNYVFSMGLREIVAFPGAESLLAEVQRSIVERGGDAQKLLLAADLEMALGNVTAAKAYLRQIPRQSLSHVLAEKAEGLSRAVLYQELESGGSDSNRILAELEELARTPRDRARFLQTKAAVDLVGGNLDAVLNASWAYSGLSCTDVVPAATDLTHLMSPQSWLSAIDGQVRSRRDSSKFSAVAARVAKEREEVLQTNDRDRLERFLSVYPGWPDADLVRSKLAGQMAQRGEMQRAELLLLQNLKSGRPSSVTDTYRALAHLWDRCGFAEEAAQLVVDCESGLPSANQSDSIAGANSLRRLVEEFPEDGLTRLAYQRLKLGARPVGRVRITQSLWEHSDSDLTEIYANAARPFVMKPAAPFQLIDHGTSLNSEISVIDRLSGTVCGTIHVPSPYSGSSLLAQSQVGHFVPLGSRASLHGVSLLQTERERPFWTTTPRVLAHDSDQTQVGPSGPTFCVFQSHRHLFVVDPGTGKLLWQRTDLDPQSGLGGDPVRGIFGDDEVIVVLAADRLNYTLYRTATGEQVRQGTLESDTHHAHERRTFGRCLAHFTSGPNHRLQIWDPLTDRSLYDREISEHFLWKETGDDELAVITAAGQLEIVDGRNGQIRASTTLASSEIHDACQIAAFVDADRYYVNLQPAQPVPEPRKYSYCFGTDTVLPRVDVRGEIVALDRKTGKLFWKRVVAQRSILRTQGLRLPLLIMLSLVGDHNNGNHRSMLVEVLDAKTGETLALEDNNFHNRVLQLTYHPDPGRVRLWGTRSVVDLDLLSASRRLSGP